MRCCVVNLNILLITSSKQRECYIYKQMHTHIRTYAHMYTCTHAYTHTRICIHVYTYIDKETLYLLYCVVAIYVVVDKREMCIAFKQ